jgi:hypothetical protein
MAPLMAGNLLGKLAAGRFDMQYPNGLYLRKASGGDALALA